jgi:hypothetical protein
MIIDFASHIATNVIEYIILDRALWPLRRMIGRTLPSHCTNLKKWIQPRERHHAPLSQQQILLASTQLGKQLELRSGRDRVARGAFLNVIIGTVVLHSYYSVEPKLQAYSQYIMLGGFVLTSLLFAMWYRFEWLTHKYRKKAGDAILALAKSSASNA